MASFKLFSKGFLLDVWKILHKIANNLKHTLTLFLLLGKYFVVVGRKFDRRLSIIIVTFYLLNNLYNFYIAFTFGPGVWVKAQKIGRKIKRIKKFLRLDGYKITYFFISFNFKILEFEPFRAIKNFILFKATYHFHFTLICHLIIKQRKSGKFGN